MVLGPFDDTRVFNIEKSKMFNRCNGIKPVEFVYLKKKYMLIFVEAKSSSAIKRAGNEKNYEKFIQEILQKFEDSFQLYMAGLFKRKPGYEEIGVELLRADYTKMNFRFMLIINGHEDTWLPPLQQELSERMKRFRSIWSSEVIVMNDKMAREYNMIF